ncbi:Inosine triphosphate pyrophosphatase [Babesia sp. Xinjiang]|uniref:Inosine triphosphate pyrophosphatase n=1 Tax=Babesia sp. Xinjiang TaxID=462227 RepID=UPI000A25CB6E|nr:Inosine triphosphate pyrophosphatase [Babesia sp. Xinjiang]ORM42221.1 Inosine triphosphate pyrophosphatase [Babesia sp. Xinjiang]
MSACKSNIDGKNVAALAYVTEIQGDPREITLKKVEDSYAVLKEPLFVEDISLCCNALNGLPGPYIKDFLTRLGPEKLYQMLNGFDDKTATALCCIGYMDENTTKIFEGRVKGKFVEPRGTRTFGWDDLFEVEQVGKTFGEMASEEKNKISHRFRAAIQLKDRAVREVPWRSRFDILKERVKPRYMAECIGTPRREYQENVINGIRIAPTFNPYLQLNKEKRYRLDNWPSRNWDDWNPSQCYVRGGRRRHAVPKAFLPIKDELGEAHPPKISARYRADIEKQYYMNGLPWVWNVDYYLGKVHYHDRDILHPKVWYRHAFRKQRMEMELKKLDKHLEDYREQNRLKKRYAYFEKAVAAIAGEELASKYIRQRKIAKRFVGAGRRTRSKPGREGATALRTLVHTARAIKIASFRPHNRIQRARVQQIHRITSKCAEKSIYKSLLQQSTPNVLKQVADSRIQYLSPFDSAAILKKILENTDRKGIAEIRRNPFYRPVTSKIIASVERYRRELLFFFLTKFYELHDTHAIKSITRVFVGSKAADIQNTNQIVELLYYAAHHIPKGIQTQEGRKAEAEHHIEEASEEHIRIYCECVRQLQRELTSKVTELKDRTLIYKLTTALPKLPTTQYTGIVSKAVVNKAKIELANNKWDHKKLNKVVRALEEFGAIDDDTIQHIIHALEPKQDNLEESDTEYILQLLETFDNSAWIKMESQRTTIIPTEAILSLSKTHPLFQSDRVTLSDEAAALIANTVEFKMKQIIQMAHRFMIKSCRYVDTQPMLLPNDIRDALRTLRMESLDGYNNCYDYRYVISSKLYKGNRVVKRESTLKNAMDERCWGRQKLTDIVTRDMQKAIPAQPGLTVHWMLVNGNVPALASNMTQCVTEEFKQEAKRQMVRLALDHVNFLNSEDANKQLSEVENLVAKTKLPMNLSIAGSGNAVEMAIVDSLQRHLGNATEGPTDKSADDKSSKFPTITIPKVEHILTKEQRFFLKEIKNTVKRASNSMDHQVHVQLGKVLSILKNSPALDQLLPELTAFFVSEIERSTGDVEAILKFAEAITANNKIQIHYHVHQLVAPLLTLILKHDEEQDLQSVHRNLCLRRLAAKTLGNIAKSLRDAKSGLEGIDQYLMTLYKRAVLDENCSLTVLYGAMCGMSHLPLAAKRMLFFPIVPLILSVLYKKHVQAHDRYVKSGSKMEEFKCFTCQEIVQLSMVMLYEACFEDILECVRETGLFSISYEAQIMIKETLDGYVDKTINPEHFLPLYTAILSRCFEILKPKKGIEAETENRKSLPEIENAERYHKMYQGGRNVKRQKVQVETNAITKKTYSSAVEQMAAPWYIGQATHVLTLTM